MNKPVTKRHPMIDMAEFERRLRQSSGNQTEDDPLAELARLTSGQQDSVHRVADTRPRGSGDSGHDGAPGQRYIGSGPFVSMSEIAAILKERLGEKAKKVPTRKLPDWLVQIVGLFDSEVRGQLFDLAKVRRPSSAKAEKELGWSHRPIAETIMDTATSLEAVGALN